MEGEVRREAAERTREKTTVNMCTSLSHLSEGSQAGGGLWVAHVGLGGANEQGLPLGLTEHADNAVHFLWVAHLEVKQEVAGETPGGWNETEHCL